ncbi:MAG: hypothetical protein IT372_14060 [Polyangiaceae bacterium]|nr:hypothetical protein [Polyangiaceae bacterium]
MSSHPKLVQFFLSLDDAAALKQFHADPEAAMDAAGLSEEEKGAIRRGDQGELASLVGEEYRAMRLVFPKKDTGG